MKSKTLSQSITFILLATFLLGAIPAFAQTASLESGDQTGQRPSVAPLKARFSDFRAEIKVDSEAARADIKENRSDIQNFKEDMRAEAQEYKEKTMTALESVETKEERKAILDAVKIERTNKRSEVKEITSEKIGEIKASQNYLFAKRFDLIAAKLQNALERIEDRMEKMTEQGMDVSGAEKYIDASQDNLNEFRSIAEKMKSLLGEKPESKEEAESLRGEIKSLATEAKAELKNAHENLREAIKVLKEEVKANKEEGGEI
jgi:DNA repair exonuclease SbcCD ATPase subunit